MKIFKDKRLEWLLKLWLLIVIIIYIQYVFGYLYNPSKSINWGLLGLALSTFTAGTMTIIALIPFFDYSSRWPKAIRIIALAFTGLCYTVLYALIIGLFTTLGLGFTKELFIKTMTRVVVGDFHGYYKNYIFFVAALYAFEYFEQQRHVINEKKDLEIELNSTKLQVLKSQIQPHFLFNSLNSIVAVIDENKKKAQGMVVKLSDILRTALNADYDQLWTLKEELLFIEDYLKIEKVRYEDQLQYYIKVSEKGTSLMVPTLILQPIVENAIRHGYKGIKRPLKLVIEVNYGQRSIRVINNGASLKTGFKFGMGLTNVARRLEIFYGTKDNFKIYMEDERIVNEISIK